MKKVMRLTILVICLLALPAMVYGQGKTALSGGLELSLPMGDFGDLVNTGFGLTLGGVYHYQPQMDFMAYLGYISWGTESDNFSFSAIPVQFGGRYFFMAKQDGGPYGGALLGIHMLKSKSDYGINGENSDTETKFSFAPLLGYELNIDEKMAIDFSARYQIVSDADYFGIRVGLNYGLK